MECLPESPDSFQAIVIGAGPAGGMAALTLARRGVRTLLVDRAAFPRPKVCGCCLAPWGQRIVAESGAAHALDGAVPLSHACFVHGRRRATIARHGHVCVDRAQLDACIARAAVHAGVQVLWRTSARVQADGSVELRALDSGDAPVVTRLRAAAVVCADGLQGASLAAHPAFAWRVHGGSRMGVGAWLPADACDIPHGEVRMAVQPWGYAGVVRLPDGRIDIAAAAEPAALRMRGGARSALAAHLAACGCTAGALGRAQWHGTPLLSRTRTPLRAGRVLVAGDAAQFVEPITGEGISWALASGRAAALQAALLVGAGERRGRSARRLDARLSPRIPRRSRWRCAVLSQAMRKPALVAAAMALAAAAPGVLDALLRPIGRSMGS